MGRALDLLEDAFEKIRDNGELLLDEEFMMNIFNDLSEQIKPFNDYLEYIFNEKKGAAVGRRKKPDDGLNEGSHAELEIEMDCDEDGKVFPFSELRS